MTARFLIRLDDACPTMRAETWGPLEVALDALGLRPIVGVIPDNRDPSLACSPADPAFWARVRGWQAKGWTIAMHGHHHLYHPIPDGSHALLDLSDKSEFVGRSLAEQKRSLSAAYETLCAQGVKPDAFMAPSHTFDDLTLQALRESTDIRVVTDGHALRAFRHDGFTWLPQQLWRFRPMPFGLWCVCVHPNSMSPVAVDALAADMRRYAALTIDAAAALRGARSRSTLDRVFARAYGVALRAKQRRHRV